MTTGIICSTKGCGGLAPSSGRHAGRCSCCVREAWLAGKPAAVKFIMRQLDRDADREAGGAGKDTGIELEAG
jgi:hypothetical protein